MHHRGCRRYRLEGLHVYKRNPNETWVHFLCRLQRYYSMAAQTPNTVMDNQPIPPPVFLTPDEQKALAVCLIQRNLMTAVAVEVLLPQRKPRRKRRVWSWPYLQRRTQYGHYDTLMDELFQENPDLYKNFTRMDRDMFNNIVEAVTPLISKKETFCRKPIDPSTRVAITLRFMATGNSYKSLQYSFRVANNTISGIVPETCNAIILAFGHQFVRLPDSPDQWMQVAKDYNDRWNFPHCIGAIDGKHVRIINPKLAGSHFHNYKKFYSMVLLGIVDAEYRFLYIDVGAVGAESDGGVWAKTKLSTMLEEQQAKLPTPTTLPNTPDTSNPMGYFFVGDDAFPLRTYLMKPYPSRGLTKEERVYNYRLSRARRTVENAFGILANRFRVFHTAICLQPDRVESLIIAACTLHNMLRNVAIEGDVEDPVTHEIEDGSWRCDPPLGQPLRGSVGNNSTNAAKDQRTQLLQYFNSAEGAVSWQDDKI